MDLPNQLDGRNIPANLHKEQERQEGWYCQQHHAHHVSIALEWYSPIVGLTGIMQLVRLLSSADDALLRAWRDRLSHV